LRRKSVGSTVDLASATWTNTIGTGEMITVSRSSAVSRVRSCILAVAARMRSAGSLWRPEGSAYAAAEDAERALGTDLTDGFHPGDRLSASGDENTLAG
jgi:hypothetical protein